MKFKSFAFDAKKSKYAPSRAIEKEFERALKRIARASGGIVEAHVDGSKLRNPEEMRKQLEAYSRLLTPWAKNQSKKLLASTIKKIYSDKAYQEYSRKMGREISKELFESDVGLAVNLLINEQVNLITSIPTQAGQRAQELAMEGLSGSRRADEIASELMQTTEVTESRAKLIARTETSRTNTALNLVRAKSVGSTQYRWRNSGDADVRHSHKFYKGRKLNGMVFDWDNPPTLDDGMTGHPGTFPNCRCYAEPILPDE